MHFAKIPIRRSVFLFSHGDVKVRQFSVNCRTLVHLEAVPCESAEQKATR